MILVYSEEANKQNNRVSLINQMNKLIKENNLNINKLNKLSMDSQSINEAITKIDMEEKKDLFLLLFSQENDENFPYYTIYELADSLQIMNRIGNFFNSQELYWIFLKLFNINKQIQKQLAALSTSSFVNALYIKHMVESINRLVRLSNTYISLISYNKTKYLGYWFLTILSGIVLFTLLLSYIAKSKPKH